MAVGLAPRTETSPNPAFLLSGQGNPAPFRQGPEKCPRRWLGQWEKILEGTVLERVVNRGRGLHAPSLMSTPCDAPKSPVRGQPERLVPTRVYWEDPGPVGFASVVSVLLDGTLTPLSLSFLSCKVGTPSVHGFSFVTLAHLVCNLSFHCSHFIKQRETRLFQRATRPSPLPRGDRLTPHPHPQQAGVEVSYVCVVLLSLTVALGTIPGHHRT